MFRTDIPKKFVYLGSTGEGTGNKTWKPPALGNDLYSEELRALPDSKRALIVRKNGVEVFEGSGRDYDFETPSSTNGYSGTLVFTKPVSDDDYITFEVLEPRI